MSDLAPTAGGWRLSLEQRVVSRLCAILAGLSAGLYLAGLVARFQSLFDPLPRTTASVICVAMVCAGLGPWVPQRVVSRFLTLLMRQMRAPGRLAATQTSAILRGQDAARRRAWWLVGAILSLAAGAAMLVSLVALEWLADAYGWLLTHTLLAGTSLRAVEWVIVLTLAGPVWLLVGLAVASFHAHYLNPDRPGRSRSLALGVVAGAAVSVPTAYELILPYGSASHAMLIGSAGFLAAAVLCIATSIRVDKGAFIPLRVARFSPPESAAQLHALILSGLLAWGLSVGLSAGVWWRVAAYERAVGASLESSLLSAWLLWMAGGVATAGLIAPRRRHSPEGCGLALWMAGVASVAALGLLALARPDWAMRLPVAGVDVRPAAAAVAVSGFFAGVALPYAKRALMVQCGGQPITYAKLMSAVLVGVGVGLYAGMAWLMAWLGVFGAQCLAGLLCMGVGGVLVVNERSLATRTQWTRGALVVGSFALLLALVPVWIRRASSAGDGPAEALRGCVWSVKTLSARSLGDGRVALASGGARAAPTAVPTGAKGSTPADILAALPAGDLGRRACVVGGDLGPPEAWEQAGFSCVEWWTHEGREAGRGRSAESRSGSLDAGRLRVVYPDAPAASAWRTWRGPFDLVVLQPVETGSIRNPSIWTAEALVSLRRCLGPGGRLVVVLPVEDVDSAALQVVAGVFRAAMRGPTVWRVHPSVEELHEVWLLGLQPPVDADAFAGSRTWAWRSLNEIASPAGSFPLHSLQTPRIGVALRDRSEQAQARRRASVRALVAQRGSQVR